MVLWIVENERKRRIVIESDEDDWHDWLLTLPTLASFGLIFPASNFHLIDPPRGGGGWYSGEFWIGVCREGSWTLTLFKD